jgi:hypothetical protein
MFKDRKDGFEKKFAYDEELRFKVTARRNKLLGIWAAERLGRSGVEAENYAKTVIEADLVEPGEEDVIRKVRADLEALGVPDAEAEVRRAMDHLMARAVAEIRPAG